MPEISVLMAVYNGERHLEETIRSLQVQTQADWELIIVDDGSQDTTPRLLARMAEQDRRLRVITQANAGLTASLNRSLALASSPYVARIDVGDVAHPDRFTRQRDFLEANRGHVAVGSHLLWITSEGWPVGVYRCPVGHEEIDSRHIAGYPGQVPHAGLMARQSAMLKVGGYAEEFVVAQDYDLLLRLGEIGQLANLDDVLTKCRVDLDGVSTRRRSDQVRWAGEAFSRARRRRGLTSIESPRLWTFTERRDVLMKWTREAIQSGYYSTARRYAWRLCRSGLSLTAIRLLLRAALDEARCAVTGKTRLADW